MFYCLWYEMDVSTDIMEEQVWGETDPNLNYEEDIRMENSREEYWRDVAEEGDNNNTIHSPEVGGIC